MTECRKFPINSRDYREIRPGELERRSGLLSHRVPSTEGTLYFNGLKLPGRVRQSYLPIINCFTRQMMKGKGVKVVSPEYREIYKIPNQWIDPIGTNVIPSLGCTRSPNPMFRDHKRFS